MQEQLKELLEKLLFTYPDALSVTFTSLELPVKLGLGDYQEVLERYNDIPMMSIDDSLNTSFSFIVSEEGTVIIFFIRKLHFVSVFVKGENPNKELAYRMFESFKSDFEKIIDQQ